MKVNKYLSKSFKVIDSDSMYGIPSDEDYQLIKSLTNSDIPKEELFVYPIVLCDNDVDRQNEQFSLKALNTIKDKFLGCTGIHDHEAISSNQHSKTYKTEVKTDESKKVESGENYTCVVGYQYTLNNDKNKDLIADIKAGIKDGVSIGFKAVDTVCSICGQSLLFKGCKHRKGIVYDGVKCIGKIDDVTEAYEWSFTPVPAQRKAGLTKGYNMEGDSMELKDIIAKACNNLDQEETQILMKSVVSEDTSALKDELEKTKAALKELEIAKKALDEQIQKSAMESAIEKAMEGLVPANEVAKALALDVISKMLATDAEGNVTGVDEAKAKLASDYKFLFNHAEPDGDEATTEDEEPEEKVETKTYTQEKTKPMFSMNTGAKVTSTKRYVPGIQY